MLVDLLYNRHVSHVLYLGIMYVYQGCVTGRDCNINNKQPIKICPNV